MAQSTGADPWSKVPALPKGCYTNDSFSDKLSAAGAALDADRARQEMLNAEIKQRFETIDIAEKARLMQAYMMKDPQAAAKMLQGLQAAGTAVNSDITASNTNSAKLEQERTTHTSNFRAVIDKTVKPLQLQQADMIKTKTRYLGADSYEWLTAADKTQYVALVKQENAEYEKVCASFFGPMGLFPRWLSSYKSDVVTKLIAAEETNDNALVGQMAIMDTPAGGYRSTAALRRVSQYLDTVGAVYSLRRAGAASGGQNELSSTR
jgi:hypothetical protein